MLKMKVVTVLCATSTCMALMVFSPSYAAQSNPNVPNLPLHTLTKAELSRFHKEKVPMFPTVRENYIAPFSNFPSFLAAPKPSGIRSTSSTTASTTANTTWTEIYNLTFDNISAGVYSSPFNSSGPDIMIDCGAYTGTSQNGNYEIDLYKNGLFNYYQVGAGTFPAGSGQTYEYASVTYSSVGSGTFAVNVYSIPNSNGVNEPINGYGYVYTD